MRKALLIAFVFAAGAVSPVLAANANHPYANCDKKVDDCGPTGNDQTDRLNSQQIGGSAAPMNEAAPMHGSQMPAQGGQGMRR